MTNNIGKYRIRNWSKYNKALINRGSLNIWFEEDAVSKMAILEEEQKKGRPKPTQT